MFGEYLVKNKQIAPESLSEALQTQKYHKQKLGRLLRDLGYLTQEQLNASLAKYLQIPVLELSADDVKNILRQKVESPFAAWAERNRQIRFVQNQSEVLLLSSFEDNILEAIEKSIGLEIPVRFIKTETFSFMRSAKSGTPQRESYIFASEDRLTDDQKISKSTPYPSLFRDCIQDARTLKASDIHVQPTRDGIDIRFRVNGDMRLWKKLGIEHRQGFINEVKKLTNLSIAVSGKPQDSRVSFKNWKLDIRVSLLPSQFGEKIVLRLLDLTRRFEFSELGFDEQTKQDLKHVLSQPNGLIIVSGPTGSGKTTTLYTLLSYLDRAGKNIITLEDPIEYSIPGLTQVQCGPQLSFASALRAVLRQDPDIILLGEIRDAETADLCLKAAATGHLVLSTLHANSASEVIARLVNLGADEFMLKSCLKYSSAQRLVKRLCPDCAFILDPSEKSILFSRLQQNGAVALKGDNLRTRNISGCAKCTSGILGRLSILEYISDREMSGFPKTSFEVSPTLSLKQAYLKKAEKGEVDVHDVFKIA